MLKTILPIAAALAVAFQAAAQTTPIKHIIVIMQENRTFDSYFGTYPGANGIPAGVCVPINPYQSSLGCIAPFHDPHDVNAGGPHGSPNAQIDLDDGVKSMKMDGFVFQQQQAPTNCTNPNDPSCSGSLDGRARYDVMGYHDATDIPNYWAYAQNFVLQDAMFEGERSWSLPAHLDMTSEWVASCTDDINVATCTTSNTIAHNTPATNYPWVNLPQLLDAKKVTWKYYLDEGTAPDCSDDAMDCPPEPQFATIPSYWNPVPNYTFVKAQPKAYLALHVPKIAQFYADIAAGSLPAVSWIVPTSQYSEHTPNGVTAGMEYVTALVNAVASSPYWNDTAIFISWDDWGGFYDHAVPPNIDFNSGAQPVQGFGIRVPGLVVSAYAKRGFIDHSVLSNENYAAFIEDVFMGGTRLDPQKLGQPDSRPRPLRDSLVTAKFFDGTTTPIGNLMNDFDFSQPPRPPLILSPHIPTAIHILCRGSATDTGQACTQPTVAIAWNPVAAAETPGPTFTYRVTRDGVPVTACTGTATSCVDKPPAGPHLYRAYTVDSNGTKSPSSAAAEADAP